MEEILKTFSDLCSSKKLVWIATSLEDSPHLVPVCFVKYAGGRKLLIANIFISKTEKILEENPRVALASASFDNGWDGYLLKGRAQILSSGEEFETFKREIEEKTQGKRSPVSVIAVEVEEAYSLKPGKGKKRIF